MGIRDLARRWLDGNERRVTVDSDLYPHLRSTGLAGQIYITDEGVIAIRYRDDATEGLTPLHYTSMMGIPAFRCGVQIIAQSIAAIDLTITLDGEEQDNHPIARLWNSAPNKYQTPYTFKEQVIAQLLTYGNFYAFIERENNSAGMPVALHTLSGGRYRAQTDGYDIFFAVDPEAQSYVTDRLAENRYSREEVFFVPGLGYDGVRGYSPLDLHRQTLRQTLATYDYGRDYFTRGGKPEGYLTTDSDITASQSEGVSSAFDEELKKRKTPVLSRGLKYQSVARAPNESQFLETREANVVEIARILNIPPAMLHDLTHATYSNVAQQTTSFVDGTIRPWTRRLESAIKRQLLMMPNETDTDLDCRFNLMPLYSTDRKTRMESYALALDYGIYTLDEVRAMEGLPEIDAFEDMMDAPVTDDAPATISENEDNENATDMA